MLIVNFDQSRHAQISHQGQQWTKGTIVECRQDEQYQISSIGSRLINLVLRENEVLAENWDRNRLPHCPKIIYRTPKEFVISQNGDRRGPASLIPSCLMCGVQTLRNLSGAG